MGADLRPVSWPLPGVCDARVVRAVWFRTWAELRSRGRAVVGTALLVGLGAGIVIAAVAGARRTNSAYPRFLQSQRAFDVFVGGGTREGLERAAQLPQIAESTIVTSARGVVVGSRDTQIVDASTGTDDRLGRTFNRFKMLHGRPADPRRADEMVASFVAAKRYGLRVGQTVRLRFEAPEGNANSLGPSF